MMEIEIPEGSEVLEAEALEAPKLLLVNEVTNSVPSQVVEVPEISEALEVLEGLLLHAVTPQSELLQIHAVQQHLQVTIDEITLQWHFNHETEHWRKEEEASGDDEPFPIHNEMEPQWPSNPYSDYFWAEAVEEKEKEEEEEEAHKANKNVSRWKKKRKVNMSYFPSTVTDEMDMQIFISPSAFLFYLNTTPPPHLSSLIVFLNVVSPEPHQKPLLQIHMNLNFIHLQHLLSCLNDKT
ncbi:hypothetical protein V8E55_005708 [Tylopilus felleus]